MENKKIKIGIDLDDTVWKFHEKFFEFYNEKYGTSYSVDNYDIYNFEEFLGITREQVFSLLDEHETLDKYKKIPLLDFVKESLLELDKKYEIHFITARADYQKDLILSRLSEIFDRELPIFFQYDENRNEKCGKVDYCLENGIKIMIDDGYHNLIKCSENGIKCFLIDYAWNKEKELNENIIRVNNWKEIMEEIK
ncbi:MAG: hypothetical protein ACE5RF_04920 [Nitrosarchaeum sp.]